MKVGGETSKTIPEGNEGRGTTSGSEGQHAQGNQPRDSEALDQAKRNSELFKNVSVPHATDGGLPEASQRERNRSLWSKQAKIQQCEAIYSP